MLSKIIKKTSKLLTGKLVKESIFIFLFKITSTLLTVLTSVLLARILEPEGFGYYSFTLSIISILLIPTMLGLPNLVVRFVSSYLEKMKWGLLKGFLIRVNQIVVVVSISTLLIAFSITFFLSEIISSLDTYTMLWGSTLIPLLAINQLRTATLRGLGHTTISLIPEMLIRQGIIVIVLLGIVLLNVEIISSNAMLINLLGTFISFVIGLVFLKLRIPKDLIDKEPLYQTKEWIKPAFPLLIAGSMQVINKNTDIIILGTLIGPEASGTYQVATKGAEFILFGLVAINLVLGPVYSRLFVKNELIEIQRIVKRSTSVILIYAVPITLLFIILSEEILVLVFGDNYSNGANSFGILSFGQMVNVMLGSVGLLLNMTGNEKDNAIGVIIAAILNVFLNIILVPKFGLEGAAISTALSIIVWNVILAFQVYKRLGIITLPFHFKRRN